MSPYRGISLASFFGCAPAIDLNRSHDSLVYKVLRNQVTPKLLFDFICNPISQTGGRADFAPYGLRKIEASINQRRLQQRRRSSSSSRIY